MLSRKARAFTTSESEVASVNSEFWVKMSASPSWEDQIATRLRQVNAGGHSRIPLPPRVSISGQLLQGGGKGESYQCKRPMAVGVLYMDGTAIRLWVNRLWGHRPVGRTELLTPRRVVCYERSSPCH